MQHEIVHHISGRIRLRLPELESPESFARLQSDLEGLDRLKSIRFNPAARSLTIEYRPEPHEDDLLGELFARIDAAIATPAPKPREFAPQFPAVDFAEDWEPLAAPLTSLAIAGVATVAELPIAIVAGAIGVAAWPIVERGLAGLTDPESSELSGNLTVDLLDTLWMLWLVAQGQFVAPALLATFTETNIAVRDRTRREEREEIAALLDRQTRGHAWIDRGGRLAAVEVPSVRIGDVAAIGAGDRLPIDGEIVSFAPGTQLEAPSWCRSASAIAPSLGREIDAGTLVARGKIRVRARRSGRATHAAIVRHLADTATLTATQFGARIETAANALVAPTLAASGALLAMGMSPAPLLQLDFGTGLSSVLPTTALSATIGAARQGIYLRDARVLERLASVSVAVFELSSVVVPIAVTQVYPVGPESVASGVRLASLAVSVCDGLDLGVSGAIERYGKTCGAARLRCDRHHLVPGGGIEADTEELDRVRRVCIGSATWLGQQGIDCEPLRSRYPHILAAHHPLDGAENAENFERLLWIACDGELLGALGFSVQICPTAREAIAALKSQGIATHFVGDDRPELVRAIATQLGIMPEKTIAAATPDDRLALFERLGGSSVPRTGEILWVSRDRDFEIPGEIPVEIPLEIPEDPAGDKPRNPHGLLADIGPTLDVTLADRRVDLVAIDGDLRDLPHAIAIARQASDTALLNALMVALPNLMAVFSGTFLGLHPIWAVTINQCAVLLAEFNGLQLRQGRAKSHRWPQRVLDEIETAPDDRDLEALFGDRPPEPRANIRTA